MENKQHYEVTLKDGTKKQLSLEDFKVAFPVAGHNFSTRLTQMQRFFPTAVDWDMVEGQQ